MGDRGAYIEEIVDELYLIADSERTFSKVAQESIAERTNCINRQQIGRRYVRAKILCYWICTFRLHLIQEPLKVKLRWFAIAAL